MNTQQEFKAKATDGGSVTNEYDPNRIESKWRDRWQEMEVYAPDNGPDKPDYVIDTPPPYPTGNFHVGNALGWCYIDFAARYSRLQGYDVDFPQGWDCHGLPTEVKVEENRDIHRTDVSREQFREWCIEHTENQIDTMKTTMRDLGFSQNWDHEFRTMDPEYWGETQRSFVRMAGEDYIYRDEHPVNWCPRCETAIADAEIENENREGTLFHVTFQGIDNDDIEIATTRPELLPACVGIAVHPDDERYTDRIGDWFEVPLFGQEVELFADEAVDSGFGTGAVMVCTFGDKQDVDWWIEYDLDLRVVLTEDGKLDERAGEFAGMGVEEAKDAITEALIEADLLNRFEPTEQSIGVCWRCNTPIEILSKEQWFVQVDGEKILERAREVEWIPEHMYIRLEEWTEGMEWDWVISRQRVFATPIPVWFCGTCHESYVAREDELPVDPTNEEPAFDACPSCGARDHWNGETDVMDTWMDSSISALYVAGWPDADFEPVQLREQGHDIIRTWAFYTILRTSALEDDIPWEQALINGMVFGKDGNKMSKSRGNFVRPEEAIEEYSADAFRQALAMGGQPGSDIQFQWMEIKSATRFLTKVWNITKFIAGNVEEDTLDTTDPDYREADRWVLTRMDETATRVSNHMDDYRFDAAIREIREFVWHDLADDYLELVKGRIYKGSPDERNAASYALFSALSASLRMLSPFAPFLTEEAYHTLPGTEGSVHAAEWPEMGLRDQAAAERGQLIADIASEIRGWKADHGMALNAEIDRIELYFDQAQVELAPDTYDLANAVNGEIYLESGQPNFEEVPVAVEPDYSVIGPEFRDRAGDVISKLEAMDPAKVQARVDAGEGIRIAIKTDGEVETVMVDPDAVTIETRRQVSSGEEVSILDLEDATVLIYEG